MKPEPQPHPSQEDRLSGLPDHLLHRIFSFAGSSVSLAQSSVLSRRWRHLYASAPVLSFNYHAFVAHRGLGPACHWGPLFTRFVRKSLSHHDPSACVVEFVFDASDQAVRPETVEYFVTRAVEHRAQRIEISVELTSFQLPTCLYTSQSLKELALRSPFLSLPNEVGFRTVRKMELELVRFSGRELDGQVFSRCPNLEVLVLTDCKISNATQKFCIAAPKLAKLSISYTLDLWYISGECEFEITAPRLACFRYRGVEPLRCTLTACCPLDEVEIDVFASKVELLNGSVKESSKARKIASLMRMLSAFKHAKVMNLSKTTKEVSFPVPLFFHLSRTFELICL